MDRSNVAGLPGVESFWRSELPGEARHERVLPTGRAQVVVDLDTGTVVLVGPRTVSAVVARSRRTAGFSLSGSGLARIVGGDAHHLVDRVLDLRDLDDGPSLPDRFDTSGLLELARQCVSRFDVDDPIVVAERMLRSGASAASVLPRLGVDRRTFVPVFRRLVGTAPKHYELLGRVQRVNAALRSDADTPIATIAADLGFADQAHMTRDVRRLTEHTPIQIRRLGPGPSNHVPVDADA